MKNIAIVTGASSGMGADFARQIAALGGLDEIWLVARRRDRLQALAAEIAKGSGPGTVAIEADLASNAGLDSLRQNLAREPVAVTWLVANAGSGGMGDFAAMERDTLLGMVDLNVRALTAVTRDALPMMVPGGRIILVASLAAWLPIAGMAVYAATKAYVRSLGTALSVELEKRGISVTTLCPGPVATEFFQVGGMTEGAAGSVAGAVPSALVVSRALKAAMRRRPTVWGTLAWRLAAGFVGLVPRRLLARLASRVM